MKKFEVWILLPNTKGPKKWYTNSDIFIYVIRNKMSFLKDHGATSKQDLWYKKATNRYAELTQCNGIDK